MVEAGREEGQQAPWIVPDDLWARRTGEVARGGKKTIADYITRPFTKNIDDYLVWLEGKIGPFAEIAPRRMAGLAITLYRWYQKSPERHAARRGEVAS